MGFSDLSWPQRMAAMGDEAESVFEETYPDEFVRIGFNLPPWGSIQHMPLVLRYLPDYIHNGKRWVEVQGCGAKGLKVKLEKISALQYWATLLPVDFFIWSSDRQEHCELNLSDLLKIAGNEQATLGAYSEGAKPYLRFTPGVLPW